MTAKITRIGKIDDSFDSFILKSVLIKNDAGDWGNDPDNNAIGVIRSTNFNNNGKLDLTDVAYRTLKPHKKVEKLLYSGEILIERSGGSDSQPVGRVGLITDEISKDEFAFANFIQRISIDDSIDSTYLFYCLQQMYEMGITATMQYQTTGIRNLDWKMYTKSLFPKPLKPEQTAIASILSKVDEAILATQNSIKAAEKLKKALMQNLLTGKLKPDGTWRTEDEFYEDEKFGKVPNGWEVCKVKDFGEIQTGKTPPTAEPNVFALDSKESYMFITPGDLGDKKYIKTTERYVTEKGIGYSYKIPVNSVFLVCIGSTIGKIGLNHEVACSNQQINALIPSEENDSEYFYYMMLYRSPHFKEIAGVNATPQINKSDYGKYKILRPKNKQEQNQIANKIAVFDTEIEQKQNKIETLQRLKKSLMQNLLTGKVRVDVEKILELCREK